MAKSKDYKSLVREADPEINEPQVEYEFTNGRKMKEKKNPYTN